MDSKTPTKVLSRIHLTPTSKRILCVICGKQCENKHERLLLFNKGSKTSHCALIEKHLRIEILSSASYADHVCRNCIRKLVTIENNLSKLVNTFNATRENLQEKYGKYSKKRMFGDSEPTSKRPLFSTPGANQSHLDLAMTLDSMTNQLQTASLSPLEENITGNTMVSMCSSESLQLQTPEKNLTTIIADSQRELKRISSKENNSLLRTLNKNSLASFSMELVSAEMHRVMPTFTEYIENTIKNPRQSRNKLKKGKFVEPEIVSSTAKLLHIFNRDLNLFQSLNSIILLKGGCKQSAFNRLSSTGSCMSYKSTLAMVDKLAINWSKELTDWKVRVETDSEMEIKILKQLDDLDDAIDFMFSQDMPIEGLMMELEEMQQSLAKHRKSMHPGYYFVGDNIDMKTSVRQMTNQNQRKDHHMFNICAFMNRVDGNMLDNTTAKADIRSIPFSTFIPNENDQEQLLENFAFLIAHIWCDFIPWLYPYKCTLPQYITHEHINDTKKKTQRINMGVLLKNEQYNDQMVDICQFIHKYVPGHEDDEEHSTSKPVKILSGGDYLTFERHKSAQASMANGQTPSSRLEGLIPKMEEFHNQAGLLKVVWKVLYSSQSAKETGTLYAARNTVNARDVSNEPSQHFYACTELLNKFGSAHIVCGGLQHFGMRQLEDEPTHNVYNGEIGSQDNMKSFLLTEAKKFVDKYVSIGIPEIPKYGKQRNLLICRFCGIVFRQSKKLRKHEAINHDIDDPMYKEFETAIETSRDVSNTDFVLNHTKCALLLSLLHFNHANAIQMGDGRRIMNSNKHLYLLYKCNNCPKYAYGLLETQVQSNVLLSERKAYELMWNRTVNHRGGVDTNHPNDLDIEHQNKSFKDQAHSYRGVFTEKAISRVSRSAVITEKILTNYDKVMKVFHQSGKHTPTNINDDILTLIKQIHERRVYSFIPGRSYIGLQDITANPFHKLDGDSLRDWLSSSLKKFAQEHFY